MAETMEKIRILEEFLHKHGDDAYISNTLTKMLEYKIQQFDQDIVELEGDLREFEKTYAMSSSEFFAKFQKGILGDDMDFVEWASLYQMRQNVGNREGSPSRAEGLRLFAAHPPQPPHRVDFQNFVLTLIT
jgi:hypothetical protein